MALSEAVIEEIVSYISTDTGSVGGPNFSLQPPDEETEQIVHQLFTRLLEAESGEEKDAIVAEIADLRIDRLQSGLLSPILYYLYPTHYPIINSMSVDGLAKYFDESASESFDEYLDHCKTLREIRDTYGFRDNCRDLDYFFVWANYVEDKWDHDWT